MAQRPQNYVPISVKGMVLSILVLLLLVAGKDNLLALVAGLAPLAFAGGSGAPEEADDDDLELVVERLHEVQVRAWRPFGALAHIIDLDHPDRGVWAGSDLPMPLVKRWPDGWPARQSLIPAQAQATPTGIGGATPSSSAATPAGPGAGPDGLTTEDVDELVAGLREHRRHLVILGAEDTGKTSAMLGLFLQAQHARDDAQNQDERRRFPLPLRVSLAGWPEDDDESDAMTFFGWLVSRLQEDYPGLLAHGASLETLLTRIWESDELRGDRLMLFIDGVDMLSDQHRVPLLERIFKELRGRSAVLACRTDTWHDLTDPAREGWAELTLAVPGDVDVERYLNRGGQVHGHEFVQRLISAGPATAWLRSNPRLLATLHDAYRDQLPNWLPPAPRPAASGPGRPGTPPAPTATDIENSLWDDLLDDVAWPNQVPPEQARSTLQWIAREGLFASTRFAWWHVPQAARTDPTLAAAYRWMQWRRAGSALAWALATFAIGFLALTWLLWEGTVQGYDRASHGLQAATGLNWTDVKQWKWRPAQQQSFRRPDLAGLLDTVVTNPVYLAIGITALVAAVTLLLARFGGEFEHQDGGQPQTIRLGLPRWRDLRSLPPVLQRGAALLVVTTVVLAFVLQSTGVGVAGQLWAGSVFAALFVLVLAWLHWCADASDDLTPAGTFTSDRMSSRAVALALGTATTLVSAALSWYFTAAGHVPTLGQCLWIVASASTAIGLARGFCLGAGMGAPLLLRVRPGFGIGYAARLRLLERALKRRPVACSPVAVIEILDLERTAGGVDGRASRTGLDPAVLLRRVGPLFRLRESSLESYLARTAPRVTPPEPAGRFRSAAGSAISAITLSAAAAVAVLTCTGMAAVVMPRLPCAQWNGLSAPGLLSGRPASTVWLENGQCVGFDVLSGSRAGGPGGFTARGVGQSGAGSWENGDPEKARAQILNQIAEQNAGIPALDRVVTVLFLAPLTRTSGSNAINALWQLDGARAAQRAVNAEGNVYVRLVVANSGENFTSGPSVVQAIDRAFPSNPASTWSIKAVIGVAQSRTSAREALAQFRNVQIVAASVNGSDMRHGLIQDQDPDFGDRFVSVSPSDAQVTTAMVAPSVLEQAHALLPAPQKPARLEIIRDPDDTYFSNDLANDLANRIGIGSTGSATGPDITPAGAPQDLREVATTGDYRALAGTMCSAANAQAIWLFAGRGDQLAGLDQQMPAGCNPVVIAGPGAISAISGSDSAGTRLQHMHNLFFYSLATEPAFQSAGSDSTSDQVGWADGVARASDRATGYAALVEAFRRIPPTASRGCPQNDPGVFQIGVDIPPAVESDGHNTLQASTGACGAQAGSSIYLCRFQTQPGAPCIPATGATAVAGQPAGPKPHRHPTASNARYSLTDLPAVN